MAAGRRGAQALSIPEHFIGGEAAIVIRHDIGSDRRPLLDMTASAADAKIDPARFFPAQQSQRLALDHLPLTAPTQRATARLAHDYFAAKAARSLAKRGITASQSPNLVGQ